jgi:hypothetical protein
VPKRDAWPEEMIGRKRWVAKSVQMWWVAQTYEWPKELSGGQKWWVAIHNEWPKDMSDQKRWVTKRDEWPRALIV